MDERQPTIFGEVADLYDRVRPGYPDHLFKDLTELCDLAPASHVVEVGAGTGKATAGLAALGLRVTAIEPSKPMADVLQARALPGVQVQVVRFEDAEVDPGQASLVLCAQAWHWVQRPLAYTRTHVMLEPGGHLALVANRRHEFPDDLLRRIRSHYARFAPGLEESVPGSDANRQAEWVEEIEASGLFGTTVSRDYLHGSTVSPSDFVDLLATQSDHRLLPREQLDALLDAIRSEVEPLGHIDLTYDCHLLLARRT